jgi:hypothetical protein
MIPGDVARLVIAFVLVVVLIGWFLPWSAERTRQRDHARELHRKTKRLEELKRLDRAGGCQ